MEPQIGMGPKHALGELLHQIASFSEGTDLGRFLWYVGFYGSIKQLRAF